MVAEYALILAYGGLWHAWTTILIELPGIYQTSIGRGNASHIVVVLRDMSGFRLYEEQEDPTALLQAASCIQTRYAKTAIYAP